MLISTFRRSRLLPLTMEQLQPRKCSGRMKKKKTLSHQIPYIRSEESDDMMTTDPVEIEEVQVNSIFSRESIIYYALILLKVGLWTGFAWTLSFLHLGTPCFLLPLILWLYSGPMHRALNWAKRRLRGPVA